MNQSIVVSSRLNVNKLLKRRNHILLLKLGEIQHWIGSESIAVVVMRFRTVEQTSSITCIEKVKMLET